MPHNARIISTETGVSVQKIMERLGVHPEGIKRMSPKAEHSLIFLEKVNYKAAHILKQEMLAIGGDAAVSAGISDFVDTESDILLMGTRKQIGTVIPKLRLQPFGLKKLSAEIEQLLSNMDEGSRVFTCGEHTLTLGGPMLLMGILNVTPDSFSDGNRYLDPGKAVDHALEMIDEGADIIDIGGESTRPGARLVDTQEELERILPVLKRLAPVVKVPISIDTYKKDVAKVALDHGASIVNDISGLRFSPGMASLAARYNAGVIIMHMQGTPQNMQENPDYADVNREIYDFLVTQTRFAESEGVLPTGIVIDPGIGFGKTVEHNLLILKNLRQYRAAGKPVLVGPSRKSFIGSIVGGDVNDRLAGTASAAAVAAWQKADILRVHDVDFMKQVIRMTDAILKCNENNNEE